MASQLQALSDIIWDHRFWLPENNTWDDLKRDDTIWLPDSWDLLILFPSVTIMFVVRLFWERYVATTLGRAYHMKETPPRGPVPNAVLEKAYRQSKTLPEANTVVALSKQTDLTERQIERWWRRRRLHGKPSEMQRFRETSWRFLYYFFVFWYGLYTLWDKPWLWDTKECWKGYPRQHVGEETRFYYVIQLSFYGSLIISVFMDNKRKDFWEMVVHHIITIFLMVFSWANNMIRIGSLVLCLHDAVDYWMEGAKLAKYMKYHKLCDAMFIIFTIMWFITRICLYPATVVRASINEGHYVLGIYGFYYLFNTLLIILQVLHLMWFYLICRMTYLFVVSGKVEKDERSETEPEPTTDEDQQGDEDDVVGKGDAHETIPSMQGSNNNLSNGKTVG